MRPLDYRLRETVEKTSNDTEWVEFRDPNQFGESVRSEGSFQHFNQLSAIFVNRFNWINKMSRFTWTIRLYYQDRVTFISVGGRNDWSSRTNYQNTILCYFDNRINGLSVFDVHSIIDWTAIKSKVHVNNLM